MDPATEFNQALQRLTDSRISMTIIPAVVESVNEAVGTCDVTALGDMTLYDVRLRASINGELSEFVVYPEIGSQILIANIGQRSPEYVVVSYSEVTKLAFKAGTTSFIATAAGVQIIRDGQNLGQQLSALISQIQAITVPVTTAPGVSGPPANTAAFEPIRTALTTILP